MTEAEDEMKRMTTTAASLPGDVATGDQRAVVAELRRAYVERLHELAMCMYDAMSQGHDSTIHVSQQMANDVYAAALTIASPSPTTPVVNPPSNEGGGVNPLPTEEEIARAICGGSGCNMTEDWCFHGCNSGSRLKAFKAARAVLQLFPALAKAEPQL